MATAGKECVCTECGVVFLSKTRLFRHLIIHGVEPKDVKPDKLVCLVGWQSEVIDDDDVWVNEQVFSSRTVDATSSRVEMLLFTALYLVEHPEVDPSTVDTSTIERPKSYSRGLSCQQRTSMNFANEATCSSLVDTVFMAVKPLGAETTLSWKNRMNKYLLPHKIIIHHVYLITGQAATDFHAELECTQRRYEVMLPLDTIMPLEIIKSPEIPLTKKNKQYKNVELERRCDFQSEEGQRRIAFLRRLKAIFKDLACSQGTRKRYHNFITAGSVPSDITASRRLDRVYHKEIITLNGRDWIIFSISGDMLLKGMVRKLLGLSLCVALDLLPMEYLIAALDPNKIIEVPAIPGFPIYLAECKYACWEAKHTAFRIDPRRQQELDDSLGSPANAKIVSELSIPLESIESFNQKLLAYIADSFKARGEGWMSDMMTAAKAMLSRSVAREMYLLRTEATLVKQFREKFEQSVALSTDYGWRQISVPAASKIEPSGNSDEDIDEQAKQIAYEAAVTPEKEPVESMINGKLRNGMSNNTEKSRLDEQEYKLISATIQYVQISPEKEDVPPVFKRVLELLRAADRSGLWPSSSTGRQSVISQESLIENGGRGGSFSVGAFPKHLAQPKGNQLFPGLFNISI